MKEINYKDMKFNPFNLIGGEWMLVTANRVYTLTHGYAGEEEFDESQLKWGRIV